MYDGENRNRYYTKPIFQTISNTKTVAKLGANGVRYIGASIIYWKSLVKKSTDIVERQGAPKFKLHRGGRS